LLDSLLQEKEIVYFFQIIKSKDGEGFQQLHV